VRIQVDQYGEETVMVSMIYKFTSINQYTNAELFYKSCAKKSVEIRRIRRYFPNWIHEVVRPWNVQVNPEIVK
jgi:hypothetical protein